MIAQPRADASVDVRRRLHTVNNEVIERALQMDAPQSPRTLGQTMSVPFCEEPDGVGYWARTDFDRASTDEFMLRGQRALRDAGHGSR